MAHALCVVENESYKNALRICNIYYFRTATVVARTPLTVTLYVHCLSCWFSVYAGLFPINGLPREVLRYSSRTDILRSLVPKPQGSAIEIFSEPL